MPLFKSHLYSLAAYKPPLEGRDPTKFLLLDFNERTLPITDAVKQAMIDYINSNRLQMYPAYGDIAERLARYVDLPRDQLMITNGSDHGIELIFRACCSPGCEVIIPAPNFAMYTQCAKIESAKIIAPFYTRDVGFPVEEVIAAVNERTRIICIANPNNPTGVAVSREDILRIAKAAPDACILVDECYFEYSRITVSDLIVEQPNLVVTRTFSKTWGIPSLRFGYLMATEENITALLSVRGPYDINQLAVVAARAALDNPEDTESYVVEVMQKSKPLLEAFLKEKGVPFWPSAANYVWAFPSQPEVLSEALVKAGILIRPKQDLEGNTGLRMTLGTVEQTQNLIDKLRPHL